MENLKTPKIYLRDTHLSSCSGVFEDQHSHPTVPWNFAFFPIFLLKILENIFSFLG